MSVTEGSPLTAEWRSLLERHARVSEALERELGRKHDLTASEYETLNHLAVQGDGCRLQNLNEVVHISQSALSRLVGRLADEGLVERKSCTHDRRGIFACITDAGRDRLAEARPTHEAVLERTLR